MIILVKDTFPFVPSFITSETVNEYKRHVLGENVDEFTKSKSNRSTAVGCHTYLPQNIRHTVGIHRRMSHTYLKNFFMFPVLYFTYPK